MAIVPNVSGDTLTIGSDELKDAGFLDQLYEDVEHEVSPITLTQHGDWIVDSTNPSGGSEGNPSEPILVKVKEPG